MDEQHNKPDADFGDQFGEGMKPPAVPVGGSEIPQEHKTMGMLCHLVAFCGVVGVPFGNIVGPLVMWLIKKDEMPFVNDQGKESLNFQITAVIIGFIGILISIPLFLTGIGACLAVPLLIGLGVTWIVFVIIATVKANAGEYYRYPYSFRFIK